MNLPFLHTSGFIYTDVNYHACINLTQHNKHVKLYILYIFRKFEKFNKIIPLSPVISPVLHY